ncbi:YncE family protein [Streptosporangium sp. NPDC003464]
MLGCIDAQRKAKKSMAFPIAATGTRGLAYIANVGDRAVSVIDTATGATTATVRVGSSGWASPSDVAVSPDGTRAYTTNPDYKSVSVIDTATNTAIATVPTNGYCRGLAVHPNGTRVYVADNSNEVVHVIDTTTNTISRSIGVGSPPNGVAITPDGAGVYVSSDAGPVSLIDSAGNRVSGNMMFTAVLVALRTLRASGRRSPS